MTNAPGALTTEKEISRLILDRAYTLLAIRPRSEQELRTRLGIILKRQQNDSQFLILDKVIQKLKENKIVNDRLFAKWLVDSRLRANLRGKIFIERELQRFGIARDIIQEVLSPSDAASEFERAQMVLNKKIVALTHLPRNRFREKCFGYLARRGFSFDTIHAVIDVAVKKKYNIE